MERIAIRDRCPIRESRIALRSIRATLFRDVRNKNGAPWGAPFSIQRDNALRLARGRPRRAVARVALEEQRLAGNG